MRLLPFLRAMVVDEVTPATRGWLAAERDARIAELEAQLAASEDEKRRFQRMYGKASTEIGRVRAELAREREAQQLDGGDILASATAAVQAQRFGRVTRPGELVLTEEQVARSDGIRRGDADAALVATAEHLGNEVGPDRAAAIEGAAITLRAHRLNPDGPRSSCTCGWGAEVIRPDGPDRPGYYSGPDELARHIAEQLAAVGALGNLQPSVESSVESAPTVLVDRDGDEWLPGVGGAYYCPAEDISRDSLDALEASYGPVTEKAAES